MRDGKVGGIADVRDESCGRTGQRLVIVLKRDAVAKVVLNNLYKHTQLQDTFGANMLALVDGVPRTLRLDQFDQALGRPTRSRSSSGAPATCCARPQERAHILRALLKALDQIDAVIALIRGSESADGRPQQGLMDLLDIDEIQARAILDMQLRRLAALERQQLIDEYDEPDGPDRRLRGHPGLAGAAAGDHRRGARRDRRPSTATTGAPQIIAYDGDVTMEDLIAEEDVVVTITRGGYAKRTKTDLYRAQRRGGKGVRGAPLRTDDIVDHFFVTHDAPLDPVLHQQGPGLPGQGLRAAGGQPRRPRPARRQPAGLPAGRAIAQVMALQDYEVAPYLVLATRRGW